jgi:hypothetical protein
VHVVIIEEFNGEQLFAHLLVPLREVVVVEAHAILGMLGYLVDDNCFVATELAIGIKDATRPEAIGEDAADAKCCENVHPAYRERGSGRACAVVPRCL